MPAEELQKWGFWPDTPFMRDSITQASAGTVIPIGHEYLRRVDRGNGQMSFWQLPQFGCTVLRYMDQWNAKSYPHLVPDVDRMISSVAKLSPGTRPSMAQILRDRFWDEAEVRGSTAR